MRVDQGDSGEDDEGGENDRPSGADEIDSAFHAATLTIG
jgi:hypothetical protein